MPKINRLAKATREVGGKVVWVQGICTPEVEESWSVLHGAGSKLLPTAEARQKRVDGLSKGLIGHELWAGMETEPEDLRVPKTRYSAFTQGSSDLHEQLTGLGIRTILVCGTATNVCCDSTARDGMMLNYEVIMVEDANAAGTDAEHSAALQNFLLLFGDLCGARFEPLCVL